MSQVGHQPSRASHTSWWHPPYHSSALLAYPVSWHTLCCEKWWVLWLGLHRLNQSHSFASWAHTGSSMYGVQGRLVTWLHCTHARHTLIKQLRSSWAHVWRVTVWYWRSFCPILTSWEVWHGSSTIKIWIIFHYIGLIAQWLKKTSLVLAHYISNDIIFMTIIINIINIQMPNECWRFVLTQRSKTCYIPSSYILLSYFPSHQNHIFAVDCAYIPHLSIYKCVLKL